VSEDHRQRLRQALQAGKAGDAQPPVGIRSSPGMPPSSGTPQVPGPESGPQAAPRKPPAALRRRTVVALAAVIAVLTVGAVGLVVSWRGGAVPDTAVATTAASARNYEDAFDRNNRVAKALVERRNAALHAGDEAGWLADLDPAATALIERERWRFRNLRQLRPASLAMRPDGVADVDYKAPASQPVDAAVWVKQIMKLSEDVQMTKNLYKWKVHIDGERITVTAVEPATGQLEEKGAAKDPAWDEAPLRSARGTGVTVLSAVNSKWNPRTYLPGAQRAARLVNSLWGKRQGAPGFVVFLADERQFSTWFGGRDEPPSTIGVAVFADMVAEDGAGKMVRPNPTWPRPANQPAWLERTAGARLVLRMSRITSVAKAEHVMAHEIAHAVGPHLVQNHNLDYNDDGGLNQPTWAIEGFARWVEHLSEPGSAADGMRYVRAHRAKYGPGGMVVPANKNFYAKDGARSHFNYELAASLFLAAAKVGGKQKAVDLYIALSSEMSFLAEDSMFINGRLSGVGLNPRQVWAEQQRLIG
jgi:hypothetical protein